MKTLKKLFSVSAIVALLGTLAPMYAFGATYTAELEEAYAYAYKNGITTMTSIDNANMFGSLTRIAMAKMIANYATTVLGLEPDTSAKCSFTDVTAALDAQYDNGVTKACQLGLMGQNITAFRPNDPVTRAEFGTTLSRALNANSDDLASMNAANPYYKEHLNFLKNEGIMTQIDNPSMTEVRGYVMLMMMRADESYTPAEGCTAEQLLKCVTADDYDACIAACNGEEEPEEEEQDPEAGVTYGTLTVSKGSSSVTEAPTNVAGVEMGSLKFKAGDEDVKLTSIELKALGYGTYTDLDNVYLVDANGSRVTRQRNVDNEGNVALDFIGTYELKANTTATFTIVNTITSNNNGTTYGYEVTKITGPETVKGLPVSTDLVRSVVISNLGGVYVNAGTATSSVKVGEDAQLGELKIANINNAKEDSKIVSLKIKQLGGAAMDSIDNLYLTINGETVADKYEVNGKYITFTFKDGGYVIAKSRTSLLTVKVMGTATAEPGKDIILSIETPDDLVVKGETYGYTLGIYTAAAGITKVTGAITLNTKATISSSEISASFERNTDTDVLATQSNILAGTLKLKANDGNFTLDTYVITVAGACADPTLDVDNCIKNVKLGGRSADTEVATTTSVTYTFKDISLNKGTQRVLDVTYDTFNADGTYTWTFNLNNAANIMRDEDNNITYTTTSIPAITSILSAFTFGNTMTVSAANLKINKKALPTATFVPSAGKEVVIAKGTLEAGSNSDVTVTDIVFTDTTATLDLSQVFTKVELVIGNDSYRGTINGVAGTIDINKEILVEKGSNNKKDFELVATLNGSTAPSALGSATFVVNTNDVTAEDTEGRVFKKPTAPITFSTITLQGAGSLNATTENVGINKYDHSILAGTSGVIAEFQLKANNEKVQVKDLEVVFDDTIDTRVESVILNYNGKEYTATPNGTKAVFEALDDFVVDTTKSPLTVSIDTIKFADLTTDKALVDVHVTNLNVTKGNGVDSLSDITPTLTVTTKAFDVVPATVTATVTSSDNSQAKLNLFVDKGENTTNNGDDISTYLVDLGLYTTNYAGLASMSLRNQDGKVVAHTAASCSAISEAKVGALGTVEICSDTNISDWELSAGDNEFTMEFVAKDVTNPTYSMYLTTVKYISKNIANASITAADDTNLLKGITGIQGVDWFYNRLPGDLKLVNRN